MARVSNKLTDKDVRGATKGRLGDGDGLHLVCDAGGKRWHYRYMRARRERVMSLGPYPLISLSEARKKRDAAKRMLLDGRDPIDERRQAEADALPPVTFGDYADQTIPTIVAGFRNQKHKQQWTNTIRDYAASLRPKPIASITTADVVACLQPIWLTKSETAARLRMRIERLLDMAKVAGLRSGDNPARWSGHLDIMLGKRRKLVARGHHAALDYRAAPGFMKELRARPSVAGLGLEFGILSAARTSEVTHATWDEIDMTDRVWRISGERMKSGRIHEVPLCDRAIAILGEMKQLRRGEYIFPSFRADKPLSNAAFSAVLSRMGYDVTVHGFRSCFRDYIGDCTDFPREVAEGCLAHVVGGVEGAYRRGTALEKRRECLKAWEKYLGGKTKPVAANDEQAAPPKTDAKDSAAA